MWSSATPIVAGLTRTTSSWTSVTLAASRPRCLVPSCARLPKLRRGRSCPCLQCVGAVPQRRPSTRLHLTGARRILPSAPPTPTHSSRFVPLRALSVPPRAGSICAAVVLSAQAVERKLGCDFEIFSTFVSSTTDLQHLVAAAPTIAGGALQRGQARAAMYFLWPAAYGEATDADGSLQLGGGFVEASALLELMRTVEKTGVPSRFPHPAAL
jgi:hypothetical protein